MYNRILALDQSSKISGWSFIKDGELDSFGKWEKTATDFAVRIHSLCKEIQKKIDELKPDLIVLENIQLQQDVGTFQRLAQVQGALLCVCVENKIPYKILFSNEWRKECNFLKGNDKHRDNQKKITQIWVQEKYQKKCTQDEADAICIGIAANSIFNNCLDFE